MRFFQKFTCSSGQMLRLLTLGAIVIGALQSLSPAANAAQPGRLSGDRIQELVTGATVHMHTPVGTKVPVKFSEDGTLSGKTSGVVAYYLGASKDKGRWWVKGRRLCQQWKTWFSGAPKCIEIRRQGKQFHWKDQQGKTGIATIARRPRTAIAKARPISSSPKRALKRKPSALGLASRPITAFPEATTPVKPVKRTVRRVKPRKKTLHRRHVHFTSPPPLPTRHIARDPQVKVSAWTWRAD